MFSKKCIFMQNLNYLRRRKNVNSNQCHSKTFTKKDKKYKTSLMFLIHFSVQALDSSANVQPATAYISVMYLGCLSKLNKQV